MKKKFNLKRFFITLFAMCILISAYTVSASAAAKPKLSASKKTLTVGDTYTLTMKKNKKTVTWSTSKSAVVQIQKVNNNSVKLIAKKSGSAKITAKIGKKKYTCKVTVKAAPKLNKKFVTLMKGKSVKLKLTGGSGKAKWKNSDKSVVSMKKVSKNVYKITAKKAGTANITVKIGNKTLTCSVLAQIKDYGGKGKRGTYELYHSTCNKSGFVSFVKGSSRIRKAGSELTLTPTLDAPGDIIRGYCNRDKAQWRVISGNSVVITQYFHKSNMYIPTGYLDAVVHGVKKGRSVLGLYESGKLLTKVTVNVTREWQGYDYYKKWKAETTKKIWQAAYPGKSINSLTDKEKVEALVKADLTKYAGNGERNYFRLVKYGVPLNKENAADGKLLFVGDVAEDLGCNVGYYYGQGYDFDDDEWEPSEAPGIGVWNLSLDEIEVEFANGRWGYYSPE